MTVRYPAGPITPHGWWNITKGIQPTMRLTAYDGSVEFYLMGGHSIPDRHSAPEAVHLISLKGLVPPWKHITQKGATQDGVTHIDALYDPVEVEMVVECRGRDARHTRKVYDDLIASIDAIQESKLDFLTPDVGYWWANIRWFQGAPPDPVMGAQTNRVRVSLRLSADRGFWSTYDHTDAFTFVYDDMTDTFTEDNRSTQDLGDIPQYYTGDGGGFCTSYNGSMFWWDDPEDTTTTQSRRVINGPWPGFDTETDNQVVSQVHGSFQEWSFPDTGRNLIGGRMNRNPDDTWAGDGVFVEYGGSYLRLFYTVDFVEHTIRTDPFRMLISPIPGEKFSLVCGYEGDGNERLFKFLRNGVEIWSVKESGAGSKLGPDHRGAGNGMFAGSALITQATPATIRKLSAGDNATVSQSGFLERINIGDQKMYNDYTLFGPGIFKIYDGPGTDEFVEFGPLLPNQIVFLRTDPRVNTTLVQDLTAVPPTPQQLTVFQDAINKFLSFAGMNNSALGDQIKSMFGVRPPQGNLYKYLKGRFSENSAIPAKSPGADAKPYFVKVAIEGGNADSKVIVSGTPLRRKPF
ncbi:hypothetical protein A5742_27480 [Mycolicibacterium fortuitum]|uniref:DUF7257 domain-containing protein n=1 Tax=Mycolicibacterium fortuitum TaxID=1766 RepID=A0ABD6QMG3_MYCFO|nr:hypothetical protein [Mycolicibacterium fortuitum]OMC44718.1 hypothetical protein A5742_27480 [Mycolicibacterium fortuitum]